MAEPVYRVFFNDGHDGSEDYENFHYMIEGINERITMLRDDIDYQKPGESTKLNLRIFKIQYPDN